MAIQFVPQEPDSGLAQALGGLGGLGLGLLGSYAGKQYSLPGKIKKFEAFGANPEQAKALAKSSEAQQIAWLKEAMKEQTRQKQAAMFSNLISGGQQLPVQQSAQQQPMAPQPGMSSLGALGGKEQAQVPKPGQALDVGKVLGGRSLEELQEYRDRVLRSGGDPAMIKDAVAILDRQIMEKAKLESGERKHMLEEKKQAYREQKDIDQETKPFYEKLQSEAKEAKKSAMRLNRMEELIKKGNLTGPLLSSVLDTAAKGIFGFGIDLGGLTNADSQEFKKISTDFLRGAKQHFGSRMTQRELEIFLTTIPSLLQSDEGKLRVVNNLRIFNDAAGVEKEAMDQIIAENGGRRPRDLEQQVDKRSKIILDNLADQFKKGIRGKTPDEVVAEVKKLKPEEIIGVRKLLPFQSPF